MFFGSSFKLFFIQFWLLSFGGVLIFLGLKVSYDLLFNDGIAGEETTTMFLLSLLLLLFGFAFIRLGVYLWVRIVVAELTDTKVSLINSKLKIEADWLEVESINKVGLLPRHTYRIKLVPEEKSYLFYNKYDSMWSMLGDESPTGKLIKRRKKELNI